MPSHNAAQETVQNSRNILYSISFMLLIDSIGYGVTLPIMPQLFFNHALGFHIQHGAMQTVFYSLGLAIYPATQFFGMTFFGTLSDHYGRKSIIQVCLAMMVGAYMLAVLSIWSHSFALFLISRALQGFLGGLYSVGNALVCDISGLDEKQRLKNLRLPAIAAKLGMVIGPALSIFVVQNSYLSNELMIPFILTSLLCALNSLLMWISFKGFTEDAALKQEKNLSSFKISEFFLASKKLLNKKATCFLTLAFFIYQCGSGLYLQALPLYLTTQFNFTVSQIGFLNVVMGIFLLCGVYGLKYLLNNGFYIIQLKMILLILALSFFYAYTMNELHIDLIHSAIARVWCISIWFYISSPILRLLFSTIFSTCVTPQEEGSVMGAIGQLTALSYIVSAFFIGHALSKHLVLLTCAISFFAAFIFLFLHILMVNKSKKTA